MRRYVLKGKLAELEDYLDLAICMYLYEEVNDIQFHYTNAGDFVNFMNLRPTNEKVIPRAGEKLRIGYMAEKISQTIHPRAIGQEWFKNFLKQCGFTLKYYQGHRSEIMDDDYAYEHNLEFKKSIEKAISKAERLKASR
ncbi:MAG: hypothetical protein LIP02_13220 [Bacteroidales bacterium]|nr:hypothetical protein [Bacteroidales bacterium]